MEIKNCKTCIHKNVCGLKEKYNQYVNEMKVMKEKYPEMGFTTDCPSWRFENEIGVNKCNTCKYKKQAQDDMWFSLVRDGERIKNARLIRCTSDKPWKEEFNNGEKYTLARKDIPKYVCIPSTPARKIEDIKKEEEENKDEPSKETARGKRAESPIHYFDYENNWDDMQDFINEERTLVTSVVRWITLIN